MTVAKQHGSQRPARWRQPRSSLTVATYKRHKQLATVMRFERFSVLGSRWMQGGKLAVVVVAVQRMVVVVDVVV